MKTIKIYDNDKEVYSGNCGVNTVVFRGRIHTDLREVSNGTANFSMMLSNGKERVAAQAKSRWSQNRNLYFYSRKIIGVNLKAL